MLIDSVRYGAGVTASVHVDTAGAYRVEVVDAQLGDTTITGFGCESEARTFLLFGDFDDTPDNPVRTVAEMAGLRWG
ncbi:MAG TPA: hypothetical protein VES01_04440 [Dermatophilaceae bacterium]|nr:hypothetical protein [Dermatophilaceae bacterium]